jgi:hypothetical protein
VPDGATIQQAELLRLEVVTVISAFYRSREGSAVDVAARIKSECEGKTGCAFRVTGSAMGPVSDPPGTNRYVEIKWKCDEKIMPDYNEKEFQAARLSCEK